MAKPAENELKGQAFKGFMGAVKTLFGDDGVERLVAALPPDLGSTWKHGGLVTSGWYPVGWYRELHKAAHATFRGEAQLSRRISYEATRSDLQGLYRFVLQFLSPHTLLGQAPRIFALYNRGGRVEVSDNRDGHATIAYRDCHGADRNIWEDIIGGTTASLEAVKVKVVTVLVLEGGGDGPDMVVSYRWNTLGKPASASMR